MRGDDLLSHAQADGTHLLELASALRPLADLVTEDDGRPALEQLVRVAVARLPKAWCASLTVRRGGRVTTEAATDEVAVRADHLQDRLGCGPGADDSFTDAVYVCDDVAAEERWGRWGPQAQAELGVASVLWQRLTLPDDPGTVAALTIFSDVRHAFDKRAVGMGLVLASHGSLLVSAKLARGRAINLMQALESNREIGVAMGILMQRHRITREQAFDVLRVASQNSNRKLSAVAGEVADTGILEVERRSAPARARGSAV